MSIRLKIVTSLCLIVLALIVISLVETIPLPKVGYFVLIGGSSISFAVGLGLVLVILYQLTSEKADKRKREGLTDEEVLRRLEKSSLT